MKPTDCVALEKQRLFKRNYLKRTSWWKNILFVAPALFLFLGLFGLLYLAHLDSILSYYTIPVVIIFMLATIWLKWVKRYLQNTKLKDETAFHICMGKPVYTQGGFTYVVFVDGQKRHNEHYITQFASQLSEDTILPYLNQVKKNPQALSDQATETDYFLIAYPTKNIHRENAQWQEDAILPLLLVDEKNVFVIKGVDLILGAYDKKK